MKRKMFEKFGSNLSERKGKKIKVGYKKIYILIMVEQTT